jgi:hypothetical protein
LREGERTYALLALAVKNAVIMWKSCSLIWEMMIEGT